MTRFCHVGWRVALLSLLCAPVLDAEIEKFIPRQGGDTEIWRITDAPGWRDWASYHARNCWSTDGRYLGYTHYRAYHGATQNQSQVRVHDFLEDRTISIERANSPRWAHHCNWLFYLQRPADAARTRRYTPQVMWRDLDKNTTVGLGVGARSLGTTDYRDEWLYASSVTMPKTGEVVKAARIPIRPNAEPQEIELPGQLEGNPFHPKVFTRVRNAFIAFKPTRSFFDLDGKNISMASPCLQQCHQSWSGGGKYYLFGNSQMRGRLWNEPFPSNQHYLTAVSCGDICRCGKGDRWICGSGNSGAMVVADLRSGDGHIFLKYALSRLHDSSVYQYSYDSGLHDNDAKGSPDGTKIAFVTNYDLKDGPIAKITRTLLPNTGQGLHVDSTQGFPESGRLSIRNEVIGYKSRTATTFEGLTRGMYGTLRPRLPQRLAWLESKRRTSARPLRRGWPVTSLDWRLIPEDQRKGMKTARRFTRKNFRDKGSPLMWQRQTDLYVAVVRRPDRPYLRGTTGSVELVPGENHWEILGYHILRDGKRQTKEPVRPGTAFPLREAGTYTASAVEHSGLESLPSAPLEVRRASRLLVRREKPDDFSWTSDRWLVGGRPVTAARAKAAPASIREIVHLYDGVIHREWYKNGRLAKRHDLNHEGKAIRRRFYTNGRLARRQYHMRDAFHRSTEWFDADGFITEAVQFRMRRGKRLKLGHWWFIKGTPVKHVALWRHHTASPKGRGTYVKQGADWVKIQ